MSGARRCFKSSSGKCHIKTGWEVISVLSKQSLCASLRKNSLFPDAYKTSDLLNKIDHPSTIICPITSKVKKESNILRVHVEQGTANVHDNCDIMIDQIRAIDNKRLIKKVGKLPNELIKKIKENIKIVLDLDS